MMKMGFWAPLGGAVLAYWLNHTVDHPIVPVAYCLFCHEPQEPLDG